MDHSHTRSAWYHELLCYSGRHAWFLKLHGSGGRSTLRGIDVRRSIDVHNTFVCRTDLLLIISLSYGPLKKGDDTSKHLVWICHMSFCSSKHSCLFCLSSCSQDFQSSCLLFDANHWVPWLEMFMSWFCEGYHGSLLYSSSVFLLIFSLVDPHLFV